jgi:hypothetical protein
MTTKKDTEDRQNKGLDHDASRHGGEQLSRKTKASEDDPRDGLASLGHGLDEATDDTESGFGPDAA